MTTDLSVPLHSLTPRAYPIGTHYLWSMGLLAHSLTSTFTRGAFPTYNALSLPFPVQPFFNLLIHRDQLKFCPLYKNAPN